MCDKIDKANKIIFITANLKRIYSPRITSVREFRIVKEDIHKTLQALKILNVSIFTKRPQLFLTFGHTLV